MQKKINLLIVDDSSVACQLLTYIASIDPDIYVIGCVHNGLEAIEFIENNKPDVVLMDINMPKMDGFEATRHIMRNFPIPIIICSAEYHSPDASKSFKAVEAGALALMEKPKGIDDPDFDLIAQEYIETIKTISEVKLVTRLASKDNGVHAKSIHSPLSAMQSVESEVVKLKKIQAIGIGASLGGPQALNKILTKLINPFPVPIFLCQHITAGFTEGFATWLNSFSTIPVKIASNLEKAMPNTIYIAPSEKHMLINNGGVIQLVENQPSNLINNSISKLFKSMIEAFQGNCLGIILTGMGRDGVNELFQIKAAGGLTIAQSKDNCLMFGMPKEAIQIGAATLILDLEEIPTFLNQMTSLAKGTQ